MACCTCVIQSRMNFCVLLNPSDPCLFACLPETNSPQAERAAKSRRTPPQYTSSSLSSSSSPKIFLISANEAFLSFCAPPDSDAFTRAVFDRSDCQLPNTKKPVIPTDLHDPLFCVVSFFTTIDPATHRPCL